MMEVPPNDEADKMTDAQLKRWLIKEGGYDSLAADFVIDSIRGRLPVDIAKMVD